MAVRVPAASAVAAATASTALREYLVEATDLGSADVKLNGGVLRAGDAGELPELRYVSRTTVAKKTPVLEIPPRAYAFVVIEDAGAPACM